MSQKQKLTAKQKAERLEAAARRERAAQARREHSERMKKLGIVLVCVILVLALGIPTFALSFLSGSGA